MIEQQNYHTQKFGHHIGIDGLALDENDTSELIIDGDIELSLVFMPHLPGLAVGAPIWNVPTDRPKFLKTPMQVNMACR